MVFNFLNLMVGQRPCEKACTRMFVGALRVIVKRLGIMQRPTSSRMDRYTGGSTRSRCYTAVRMNSLQPPGTTWINHTNTVEPRSQTKKSTYGMIPFIKSAKKAK